MAAKKLFQRMQEAKRRGEKLFVALIDPDKAPPGRVEATAALAGRAGVDFLFVGGSLLIHNELERCIQAIRTSCELPII
jgi:putative glycerol-1-phosphate prenyltransferase